MREAELDFDDCVPEPVLMGMTPEGPGFMLFHCLPSIGTSSHPPPGLAVQGRCQLPCCGRMEQKAEPSCWGGAHGTIEGSPLQVPGRKWPVAAPGGWGKGLSRASCRKHLQTSACPSTHTPLLWGRLLSVGVSTRRRTLPCDCHLPASHQRPVNLGSFLYCCPVCGQEDANQ